jgi:hypothetical protein
MSRLTKILLWLLASLLILIAAAVIFILTFDWNRAKPWINERVSTAIGREFAIDGNLSLHWQRAGTTPPGAATGLLGALGAVAPAAGGGYPGGNPHLRSAGQMATVRLVTSPSIRCLCLCIDFPAVAGGTGALGFLAAQPQAVNNWTFTSNNSTPRPGSSAGPHQSQPGQAGAGRRCAKINIKADIDTLDPTRRSSTDWAGSSAAASTAPR